MRSSSSRLLVIVLAVAALFVAGCGSSSGSDAADDPTTTKAEAATTTEATEDSTTTEAEATTTEAAETTEATSGDDAICAPMERLRDSDAEANKLVATGDWTKIQAFYVDNTDDIVAIYDEAIALDTEITAELETLKSVTESAGDLAASSSSLMDFSGKLTAQPNLAESGQAALDASEYVEATCGFPLAGF